MPLSAQIWYIRLLIACASCFGLMLFWYSMFCFRQFYEFYMKMESNRAGSREMQAQSPPSGPTLCRTGCGFYAHSAFDGMCSKCYKDHTVNSSTPSTSTNTTPLLTKGSILSSEMSLVRLRAIWITNHPPSVLWHRWLGHLTCKNIVSEMT